MDAITAAPARNTRPRHQTHMYVCAPDSVQGGTGMHTQGNSMPHRRVGAQQRPGRTVGWRCAAHNTMCNSLIHVSTGTGQLVHKGTIQCCTCPPAADLIKPAPCRISCAITRPCNPALHCGCCSIHCYVKQSTSHGGWGATNTGTSQDRPSQQHHLQHPPNTHQHGLQLWPLLPAGGCVAAPASLPYSHASQRPAAQNEPLDAASLHPPVLVARRGQNCPPIP
jgi:hypothetical protein